MVSIPGQYVGLNLGPMFVGSGSRVPINLGVPWDTDPPEPVVRGLRVQWATAWMPAGALQVSIAGSWRPSMRQRCGAGLTWSGKGDWSSRTSAFRWGAAPKEVSERALRWGMAMSDCRGTLDNPWRSLDRTQKAAVMAWSEQSRLRGIAKIGWGRGLSMGLAARLAWRSSAHGRTPAGRFLWMNPGLGRRATSLPWGPAAQVPWVVRPAAEPPEPPEPSPFPSGDRVALNLGCPVIGALGLAPLNLGVIACYAVRPQKGTYIVLNTISVVRLPDRSPVEVEAVSIRGSAGAWGYDVDMTLADPSHLALLKPTANGRREVEININGYVWTALIESYSHRREFVRSGVTVTGRSRTALLAAPYVPARALVSSSERSMAQLATDELADTGYTIDWDTVDWQVPAGAWYYDGMAPLDSISALAEAAGAVVQSHAESKHLRVLPRYPVSPWDWPDTTPDHIVQDDIVITESGQVRSSPMYNAVVVTGELTGAGVTARVVRQGEAGDLYAPQVSSPLITVSAAAGERGRNILADRGDQDDIDLTLPMFPAPVAAGTTGRVLPLQLVEVRSEAGNWHGQCTASRVDARVSGNAITVEQTITLERHYTDAN